MQDRVYESSAIAVLVILVLRPLETLLENGFVLMGRCWLNGRSAYFSLPFSLSLSRSLFLFLPLPLPEQH